MQFMRLILAVPLSWVWALYWKLSGELLYLIRFAAHGVPFPAHLFYVHVFLFLIDVYIQLTLVILIICSWSRDIGIWVVDYIVAVMVRPYHKLCTHVIYLRLLHFMKTVSGLIILICDLDWVLACLESGLGAITSFVDFG